VAEATASDAEPPFVCVASMKFLFGETIWPAPSFDGLLDMPLLRSVIIVV